MLCCADIPEGDKDAIMGGVLATGGLYSSSVTKMVTHIVALTMDHEKCQMVLKKDLKCKIVLPHWYGLFISMYANVSTKSDSTGSMTV